MSKLISQYHLKQIFSYNNDGGVFIRLSTGRAAGYVSRSNCKKYIIITINKKSYMAHRLAWLYVYGEFPKHQIDHINGNGLDNSIKNLRAVTGSENQRNRKINSNNPSGVTGIGFRCGSYTASIKVNNETIWLGTFIDRFDAICARKSADNTYGFHINHGSLRNL